MKVFSQVVAANVSSCLTKQIITEKAFGAMFGMSFELLDLFNAQMTAVQV